MFTDGYSSEAVVPPRVGPRRTGRTGRIGRTERARRTERSAYASIRLADRSRAKLRASSRDTCIWETPSSALICDCVRLL